MASRAFCRLLYDCVKVLHASFNTVTSDGSKSMLLMSASGVSLFSPQEYFSHLNLAQLENINDC